MKKAVLTTLMLLAAIGAQAQGSIYKTTDKDGNVVFTDAPPANAEKAERVEMRRVNTTPAVEFAEPETQPAAAAIANDKVLDQELAIIEPANETVIPQGPGNFSVNVKVSPGLKMSQSLQLFLDGKPYGKPQLSNIWAVSNVFRGEHELTAGLMHNDGEILIMSEPIKVFVLRPTIRR